MTQAEVWELTQADSMLEGHVSACLINVGAEPQEVMLQLPRISIKDPVTGLHVKGAEVSGWAAV